MADKMLTVAEIAQRLGLCKMTIYRRIRAGEIPAVKVGKSFRVVSKDFDRYLREAKVRGARDKSGAGERSDEGVCAG